MKKFLLFLSFILTTVFADAQKKNSWTIKLNNKIILATSKEDESINSKKVKAGEWRKNGKLEILFKEAEPGVWVRSILFFDKDDNQLLSKDSTNHAIVSLAELRKLFAGKKEIEIYAIASPIDPNIAVRMRRVHLCTLKLP